MYIVSIHAFFPEDILKVNLIKIVSVFFVPYFEHANLSFVDSNI